MAWHGESTGALQMKRKLVRLDKDRRLQLAESLGLKSHIVAMLLRTKGFRMHSLYPVYPPYSKYFHISSLSRINNHEYLYGTSKHPQISPDDEGWKRVIV